MKIQQQVQSWLDWCEIHYNTFVYDMGLEYLRHYIGEESPLIVRQIIESKIFWNWWKEHWVKRDQAFVESQVMRLKVSEMRKIYVELHNPFSLAAQIYPNGQVLGESYEAMMQKLKKEVINA